jgi:hypothetical protein
MVYKVYRLRQLWRRGKGSWRMRRRGGGRSIGRYLRGSGRSIEESRRSIEIERHNFRGSGRSVEESRRSVDGNKRIVGKNRRSFRGSFRRSGRSVDENRRSFGEE